MNATEPADDLAMAFSYISDMVYHDWHILDIITQDEYRPVLQMYGFNLEGTVKRRGYVFEENTTVRMMTLVVSELRPTRGVKPVYDAAVEGIRNLIKNRLGVYAQRYSVMCFTLTFKPGITIYESSFEYEWQRALQMTGTVLPQARSLLSELPTPAQRIEP